MSPSLHSSPSVHNALPQLVVALKYLLRCTESPMLGTLWPTWMWPWRISSSTTSTPFHQPSRWSTPTMGTTFPSSKLESVLVLIALHHAKDAMGPRQHARVACLLLILSFTMIQMPSIAYLSVWVGNILMLQINVSCVFRLAPLVLMKKIVPRVLPIHGYMNKDASPSVLTPSTMILQVYAWVVFLRVGCVLPWHLASHVWLDTSLTINVLILEIAHLALFPMQPVYNVRIVWLLALNVVHQLQHVQLVKLITSLSAHRINVWKTVLLGCIPKTMSFVLIV